MAKHLVYAPAYQPGWPPYAVSAAQRAVEAWHPDVVVGSALPYGSLIACAILGRRLEVPWIAELRDLWSDNHYRDLYGWQRSLDQLVERAFLRTCAGLVTVSETMAGILRQRYSIPIEVVYNGYDAAREQPARRQANRSELLLLHAGSLYPTARGGRLRRDPQPLFRAISGLHDGGVKVRFLGPDGPSVSRLAKAYGIDHAVEAHCEVTYDESLQAQADADVLVLLLAHGQRDRGVIPGKFSEYLAARRPILAIGDEGHEVVRLINNRGFGFGGCEPAKIASAIRNWARQKRATGETSVDDGRRADFTRATQVGKLDAFLHRIVGGSCP